MGRTGRCGTNAREVIAGSADVSVKEGVSIGVGMRDGAGIGAVCVPSTGGCGSLCFGNVIGIGTGSRPLVVSVKVVVGLAAGMAKVITGVGADAKLLVEARISLGVGIRDRTVTGAVLRNDFVGAGEGINVEVGTGIRTLEKRFLDLEFDVGLRVGTLVCLYVDVATTEVRKELPDKASEVFEEVAPKLEQSSIENRK
jgi:hypothetical protein